jgi:regulatory protein
MKITSVEPQKNNPNRFNIFLDGEFAFGADEDLVVDKRLLKGKEIPEEDLPGLLEESELGKLMERMYGLFGRRQRSEKEVRDYLKQLSFKRKLKGDGEITDEIASALVSKLVRKGLINDLEFAKSWVESRSKKKGINALKSELFNKGIGREIIEEVLSSDALVSSGAQTAEKLLERKMRIWKNLKESEFKQKALQFLMSRGFEYDLCKELIEKVIKEVYN